MSAAGCTVIDPAVRDMTGPEAVPRSNGELVFEAPWQSRAFGMAVALHRAGHFAWDDFRAALAAAIRDHGQLGVDEYYERWLDALHCVLGRRDLLDAAELHAREDDYRHHRRDEVF